MTIINIVLRLLTKQPATVVKLWQEKTPAMVTHPGGGQTEAGGSTDSVYYETAWHVNERWFFCMFVKFFVNTDLETIIQVIEVKSATVVDYIPGGVGGKIDYELQRAREYPQPGYRRIGQQYSVVVCGENGKRKQRPFPVPLFAYTFDLLPVGRERTEVTAVCELPEATDCYKYLLLEMAEAWPECKADILAWLEIGPEPQETVTEAVAVESNIEPHRREATEARDQFLKNLYDKYPNLSQQDFATEVNQYLEGNQEEAKKLGKHDFAADDVKNAWRRNRNEWGKWPNFNKVRRRELKR